MAVGLAGDGGHCCQMAEFWAAGLKNGPVKILAD
jgi:thiamine pyrophosphate-dependent acetolactate synthase large subunit-like protein